MVNKKRKISLLLSILILFISTSQTIASNNNYILHDDENVRITSINESNNYTKVKIENKKNNKIEFLESYLKEDGTYEHIATIDELKYRIYKENENVIIKDNNNIIETIEIINDNLDEYDDKISTRMKIPCIPNTNWKANQKGYTSKSIVYSDFSMLVGVLASIAGGPVTGVITTVATWYFGKKLKEAYYYFEVQERFNNGILQRRTLTQYYKEPNHKTKLGSIQYSTITNLRKVGNGCK